MFVFILFFTSSCYKPVIANKPESVISNSGKYLYSLLLFISMRCVFFGG